MDPDDPTDDTLIERIGRGDEHALVLLMERHKQALFRFVYRYLNNEADSAEITEATFFKVYQNAAGFKPKASPKTWIYTIALNLARDRLRKDKKRLGQLSLDAPVNTRGSEQPLADRMGSDEPSPSRSLQTDDDLQRIQKQVAQLPEKLKFPFVFCILENIATMSVPRFSRRVERQSKQESTVLGKLLKNSSRIFLKKSEGQRGFLR